MGYRFASGKNAIAICDVCGFRCDYVELRQVVEKGRLTGVRACPECWDPDHPQNFLGEQEIRDPQALRNARPDSAELAASRAQIVPVTGVFSYLRLGRVTAVDVPGVFVSATPVVSTPAVGQVNAGQLSIVGSISSEPAVGAVTVVTT